ncbi:MAG: MotA/TolQ/ExbB proton channel family protein [Limisphaerales bacterium]
METTFVSKVMHTWQQGGWTMIPLAFLSLLIYTCAIRLLVYFRERDWRRLTEEQWRFWVHHPERGEGEVGEIIRYCQDESGSVVDVQNRFAEVTASKLPPLDRRLSTLNLLISAAPLVGLLGTVFGMLMTFKALSLGGGEMTEAMATGISMALFPPEVGLCVSLPGLALVFWIRRQRQEYEAFLARLESATVRLFRAREGHITDVAETPVAGVEQEAGSLGGGSFIGEGARA